MTTNDLPNIHQILADVENNKINREPKTKQFELPILPIKQLRKAKSLITHLEKKQKEEGLCEKELNLLKTKKTFARNLQIHLFEKIIIKQL